MIMLKRIVTGSLSLAAGVALIAVVVTQGHAMNAQILLALVIFFGGGAWTLRDGIRLRRELLQSG